VSEVVKIFLSGGLEGGNSDVTGLIKKTKDIGGIFSGQGVRAE